ncbi:MAG: PaaI family thioesterase [Aeromicrobium sp.]
MNPRPGLDGALGVSVQEMTPDTVVLVWTVGKAHLQPYGIVHGGAYCTVHETAASLAGQAWLGDKGIIVGVNNNTDFLRQAGEGDQMTTTALPIHRGRKQQLWRMETVQQDGKVVAIGQVRLQNLDTPPPAEFLGDR